MSGQSSMAKVAIRRLVSVATLASVLHGCTIGEEEVYLFEEPPTLSLPADHSPQITLVFVAPLQTDVGASISLSGAASDPDGDPIKVHWFAYMGTIANPRVADTTYTCKRRGRDTITFFASDGRLQRSMAVQVTCI